MLEDEKRKLLVDLIKTQLRYLQKYISPFQALFFSGKRFDLRNRCGLNKNELEYKIMVLHLCLILSFLLTLQFHKQLRSKKCNVHGDIFFMKMSVMT